MSRAAGGANPGGVPLRGGTGKGWRRLRLALSLVLLTAACSPALQMGTREAGQKAGLHVELDDPSVEALILEGGIHLVLPLGDMHLEHGDTLYLWREGSQPTLDDST